MRKVIRPMSVLVLASLLGGTALVQTPTPAPQAQVAQAPVRAAESDAVRTQQLRVLVEAAEKALETDDEEAAAARSDEADVLTADWSPDLLKQADIQGLLQRLKEVQEQITEEEAPEAEPGLKVPEEVVSISGDELRFSRVEWNVPTNAQIDDLVLIYRTAPTSAICDIWKIVGPFHRFGKRNREGRWPGLQAGLRRLIERGIT